MSHLLAWGCLPTCSLMSSSKNEASLCMNRPYAATWCGKTSLLSGICCMGVGGKCGLVPLIRDDVKTVAMLCILPP